jgi:histidinol-phosphate aminotransferase
VTRPSTPRPRAALADVPAYVAGRPPVVREGRRAFKLSSNENPFPPLPEVVHAVEATAALVNRYPDMGSVALYAALADRLGVPTADLAVGTGSVALLYHLVQAFCEPGDEVVFAWRSFEAYPIAAAVCGARAVQVPLTADGRHDLPAMAAAVTDRTRIVLVCTPNNPTGPAVTQAEVDAFLDAVPGDVVVVLDEAYREFVRLDDPLDAVGTYRERRNVAVMRTFAKAYGLAGLRVGYLAAHDAVAAAVRACALPFGVSAVAQAAAVAALEHEAALLERVEAIVGERARVCAALRDQGWTVPDAQGNFVWLGLGDDTARFGAAAEAEGIMVRPYGADGVRVTIGEPEGNDVFLGVAGAFTPKV